MSQNDPENDPQSDPQNDPENDASVGRRRLFHSFLVTAE